MSARLKMILAHLVEFQDTGQKHAQSANTAEVEGTLDMSARLKMIFADFAEFQDIRRLRALKGKLQ